MILSLDIIKLDGKDKVGQLLKSKTKHMQR